MADKAEGKTRKKHVRRTAEERRAFHLAQAAAIDDKAKERVIKRIKALHAKRAVLVEREKKTAAQILEVDEEIASLVTPEIQLTLSSTEAEEV